MAACCSHGNFLLFVAAAEQEACREARAGALQVRDVERRDADVLLNSMVSLLCKPDASMADNIAGQAPGAGGLRLEGKLALTLALVQVPMSLPCPAPQRPRLRSCVKHTSCGTSAEDAGCQPWLLHAQVLDRRSVGARAGSGLVETLLGGEDVRSAQTLCKDAACVLLNAPNGTALCITSYRRSEPNDVHEGRCS